jgi:hypothetical protein
VNELEGARPDMEFTIQCHQTALIGILMTQQNTIKYRAQWHHRVSLDPQEMAWTLTPGIESMRAYCLITLEDMIVKGKLRHHVFGARSSCESKWEEYEQKFHLGGHNPLRYAQTLCLSAKHQHRSTMREISGALI